MRRTVSPTAYASRSIGSSSSPLASQYEAATIGRHIEAPPQVAFGARLDGPVAPGALAPFAVEKKRVLHYDARLVQRCRPSLGVRQQFHFRDRAVQRHGTFIRIIAGIRNQRKQQEQGEPP